MDDGVAGADDRAVAAPGFPGDADAGFERILIVIDADPFSVIGAEGGIAGD